MSNVDLSKLSFVKLKKHLIGRLGIPKAKVIWLISVDPPPTRTPFSPPCRSTNAVAPP